MMQQPMMGTPPIQDPNVANAQGQQFLTPDQLAIMMQAGIVPDRNAMLMEQLRGAKSKRNAPTPQGNTVRGIYQAASPLQHVSDFLGKRKAAQDIEKYEGQYEDNLQKQVQGREQMYKALIDQLRTN